MTSLKTGTTISHFTLVEPLGKGGMGEVWLADDTQLPRRLAIKFLSPDLAQEDTAIQRMGREAAATASIDHPAVGTVFETGVAAGRPYFVMQYFEGETLEERLAKGPMTPQEALGLALAIADALAEVHALGIVHRDLKPANIMLTSRGPRILDFGLASVQSAPHLTQDGSIMGTPMSMSPEQLRGGPPDNRSDLWGLGVVLYHALTGSVPFPAKTKEALFHSILHEQPAEPSQSNPEISRDVDHIVGKLLRKDPEHRYCSAVDLLADLKSALSQIGGEVLDDTVPIDRIPDDPPRLAVIPFEVMSGNQEDKYLADGLVEDLIVDLTRVEGLRVPSRAEVSRYSERNVPPRTLARELGVEYVILGSVRRFGDQARISAQLVRADSGNTLWADRFDRCLEDLFAIQAEVSRQIVLALKVALKPEEASMLRRAPTTNTEAYTLYLRARELLENNRESNLRAERLLKDALELDPEFALAHAALGQVYVLRPTKWWGGLEMIEPAMECARTALRLDPDLPDALLIELLAQILEGSHQDRLQAIERMLAAASNDVAVREWAAWGYMTLNRPEDAIPLLKDLHHRYMALNWLGNCYDMLGMRDEAMQVAQELKEAVIKRIQQDPEAVHERSLLSGMLARQGYAEEAIQQAERVVAMDTRDGRIQYNAACTYALLGKSKEALEHLREAIKYLPSFVADWPQNDPDLASLHGYPEWKELFGASS